MLSISPRGMTKEDFYEVFTLDIYQHLPLNENILFCTNFKTFFRVKKSIRINSYVIKFEILLVVSKHICLLVLRSVEGGNQVIAMGRLL